MNVYVVETINGGVVSSIVDFGDDSIPNNNEKAEDHMRDILLTTTDFDEELIEEAIENGIYINEEDGFSVQIFHGN